MVTWIIVVLDLCKILPRFVLFFSGVCELYFVFKILELLFLNRDSLGLRKNIFGARDSTQLDPISFDFRPRWKGF